MHIHVYHVQHVYSFVGLCGCECILIGDFNTNLYGDSKNWLNKCLSNFMNNCSLSQIIQEPTRITRSSCSGIDLILVTKCEKISQHGVLNIGVSNHLPVFCTRKVCKLKYNSHNNVTIRSLKNYSKDDFEMKLNEVDWSCAFL